MKEYPYKHISVLLLPTDYCNMNCAYCFNSRRVKERKNMSYETLQRIFEIVIPYYREITFIWHGGEPLSMGIEFLKRALEMQKTLNTNGAMIKNSIQSNLTLMNEETARFLVENEIHVGSSYDGTVNEKTRHCSDRILKGRELLLEQGGKCGFICVVQRHNVHHLIEDYEWFKDNQINYSLNPYLSSAEDESDILYVDKNEYSNEIKGLFDYWFNDKDCNIRVSTFLDYIDYIVRGKKSLCCYNSCMGKHIGVHWDGRIFNCNRDFGDEYCFGSVYDYKDIRECFESDGFNRLLNDAVERRNYCKEKCDIFGFCAGGCNSSALMGGDVKKGNEYTCFITRNLYHHVKDMIDAYLSNPKETEVNPSVIKLLEGE